MCSAAIRHGSASRPPQLHVFHPPAQSFASCFAAWHYCLLPRSKLGNKMGAMSTWLQSLDYLICCSLLTKCLWCKAQPWSLLQEAACAGPYSSGKYTSEVLFLKKDFSAQTWHLRAICFRRMWQWDGMLPLSCSGKLSAGCLT